MKKNKNILIHTSGSPDPITKSVVPPVHFSTIFAMETPSSSEGFQYGRVGNPTRSILEKSIADLHSANHACAFSSGSAAITTVLSTLNTGDHVICHRMVYEGTARLMVKVFTKFGVNVTFTDLTKPNLLHQALSKQTKLIWIESPTNPLLEMLDIRTLANIAHTSNTLLIVDNTFATPIFQTPLLHGADIVVESLTKGINGHSDAMGGFIATNNEEIFRKIQFLQHTMGAVLSPFDCFLILRGIKTLFIRMRQQEKNARIIAKWLRKQSAIKNILFPFFQQMNLDKQMLGSGTMISFVINPKIVMPTIFLSKLKLITIAHSFGGPETLIQQPTTMMDLSFSKRQLQTWGITDNFFRLSVGLEDPKDTINDLKQALAMK